MISTGDKTFFVFEGQDVSGTVARPVALQEEELCHTTFDEMYHTQVQIATSQMMSTWRLVCQ